MNLHENQDDFKELIQLTAEHLKISEVYIEKDYWVCHILKKLSQSEYKENIVFKGGTSLSKAYGIIERFSEDIDLQLLNFAGGDSKKKKFIKSIEEFITQGLEGMPNHPRESKSGNIRKTIYNYDKKTKDEEFYQGSKEIVLEINSMSTPEPYESKEIEPYIAEYLRESSNENFINEFELHKFKINVLDKRRTFVEKIFAVLDFSFEENYIGTLSNKIRHIYDLNMLYNDKEVQQFFESDDFYLMASRVVVENDFFGLRAKTNYSESILYDIDELDQVERTYENEFAEFVFGYLPPFSKVKAAMAEILTKLKTWENDYRERPLHDKNV